MSAKNPQNFFKKNQILNKNWKLLDLMLKKKILKLYAQFNVMRAWLK